MKAASVTGRLLLEQARAPQQRLTALRATTSSSERRLMIGSMVARATTPSSEASATICSSAA
jgi:hypothetical protein